MAQRNKIRGERRPVNPSLISRLINYRKAHGSFGLARRLGVISYRMAMKYAALALYYSSTGLQMVHWKLFPRATVLRTVEGSRRFESGRFAIFLAFQPTATPWYMENALQALAKAHINVLLVFNHELNKERIEALKQHSFQIMIRDNQGLDIGGYRDAFLSLREQTSLRRLIFLNDSVYYFEKGLDSFFERLMTDPADVVAPFENNQFNWHIQSFCLAMSQKTMQHETVQQFFVNYVPINSRRWAIHEGEVALSRVLSETAQTIKVLYRADDLASYHGPLSNNFGDDPRLFIPIATRFEYDWLRDQPEWEGIAPLVTIADIARRYSQIHVAGFLFKALFGSPMIKRDIVYREQFSLKEAANLLGQIDAEGHEEEILTDLIRKGVGSELRGLDRGRYAAGMI